VMLGDAATGEFTNPDGSTGGKGFVTVKLNLKSHGTGFIVIGK